MTEVEKIQYAKTFLDKLAKGINPIDDTPLPPGDVASNQRLSRCFAYVSEILSQVIQNGGTTPAAKPKQKRTAFSLPAEVRAKLRAEEKPLTVSEIADALNGLVDLSVMKRITGAGINNWLIQLGLLEIKVTPDGKNRRRPTPRGISMGLSTEERKGQYGPFTVVLFSPAAQQFVYDNIEAALETKRKRSAKASALHGEPWSQEDNAALIEMFRKNIPIKEIAAALKRSEGGIKGRLKRIGLLLTEDE